MSLAIGLTLGVTNIGYQTFQSINLMKETLVNKDGHIIHRTAPFELPKSQKLSEGSTDGMVLAANLKTLAMGAFAGLGHMLLCTPRLSKNSISQPELTASFNRALKCNKILAVAGIVSMAANLYFQKQLSYNSVMEGYYKNWEKQTDQWKNKP